MKMDPPLGTRRRPWAAVGLFAVAAVALTSPTVVRHRQHRHRRLAGHIHHSIDDKEKDVPLIEFAVTGFAKTGTSYLLHHVLNTPETYLSLIHI